MTDFLTDAVWSELTDIRVNDPERPFRAALRRRRRDRLAPDGRLNLLAADHPARRITAIGDRPLGMADRRDLLARIVRVLTGSRVDGVMATMDILEELLLLQDLAYERQGPVFLDGKLLIASLNRGGLAGTVWEMNDPVTGPAPAACAGWKLDGAKILWRLCDDDPASLATLQATTRAITEMNALGLPTFLEPLPVVRSGHGFKVVKTPEALAKIAGVASALGDSSRYLWLKLPYCEDYGVVACATTLPILLLGGESAGGPEPFLRELLNALAAGTNVRGALVGRNVLYPGTGDPLAVAEAVGGVIHDGWPLERALEACSAGASSAR
jgi:hypothetical protein